MTTKTVKSVKENTRKYDGSKGTLYVHMVTLTEPVNVEGDDVSELEYHSQSATCEKFVAGQAATFETEKRVNGKYSNYKIKPVAQQAGGFGGGFTPRAAGSKYVPKDEGIMTAQSCAATSAQYYQKREGSTSDVIKFAEELHKWVLSKSTGQ